MADHDQKMLKRLRQLLKSARIFGGKVALHAVHQRSDGVVLIILIDSDDVISLQQAYLIQNGLSLLLSANVQIDIYQQSPGESNVGRSQLPSSLLKRAKDKCGFTSSRCSIPECNRAECETGDMCDNCRLWWHLHELDTVQNVEGVLDEIAKLTDSGLR